MQRWNGCLGLTTTDCLRRLGIFHLPKLKIITIGNLPVKPPQRSDLNQLASLIPGAIQEGAKFWLQVVTELKNRGVQDIFIACVDGLKGFPEAIESVYPQTAVQLCVVHMVRHSLNYVSWKMRKAVAADLRTVYAAATLEAATAALHEFEQKWGADYPPIVQSWRRNWERITPFFDYPPEVRRIIYTTNAIESVNMSLRKITKNRGAFPSDEALLKLFYLALNNIAKKWTMPVQNWKPVLNRFTIQFGERMPTN